MKKFKTRVRDAIAALLSAALLVSTLPLLAEDGLIGEGTIGSPYLISSAEDLCFVAEMVEKGVGGYAQATYKLTQDIDLESAESFHGIGQYHSAQEAYWFQGRFDGDGHKILNYKAIDISSDYIAFFPRVTDGAVIENVSFINPKVQVGSYAAVVAGYAKNATFRNVKIYNASVASMNNSSGGIVHTSAGSNVEKCAALDSTVYCKTASGGIVCQALSGATISECQFRGEVRDEYSEGIYSAYLGGIVGYANLLVGLNPKRITIENCLAQGSAIAKSAYSSGGIVGIMSDNTNSNAGVKILNCISDMEVEAKKNESQSGSYAGGIAGAFAGDSQDIVKRYFIEGNLAFGKSVAIEVGEAGRIYSEELSSVSDSGNIANKGMLVNGAKAEDNGPNGTGVPANSILDGTSLPSQFKQSPWAFKPGALPYLLFGDEEETAESEVFIKAPQAIEGKAGTVFNSELWLGKWESGIKALEAVLSIPDGLELVSLTPSSSISGGSLSHSLDEAGKLRLAYMNTEAKELGFELGPAGSPAFEVVFKLKGAMAEGDKITLSADSVRLIASSIEPPLILDVSKAVKTIEITGEGHGPTLKARELYAGDGVDLIPENMKAVAVEITGLSEAVGLTHESYQFFYAPEFEVAMTYIALVGKGEALSSFEDYDGYSESQLDKISFGKASGQSGELSAQDALAILSFWLRKTAPDGPKGILRSNVSADGRIDTIDALAVVERFVSQTPFAVLSK